ncbi:MAG: HD domain-containing protein [Planctomycetota bacterium]
MSTRTLRDPVHGDIELTHEEIALIDTRDFQRLRGVKQLGTASLVYPGAVHTRFEHSIGTMHCADRMIDAVNRNAERDPGNCLRIGDEDRRTIRIAALLHDVTHVPFGHNLEDQTGLLARHDHAERFREALGDTEIGSVLDGLGLRSRVLGMLCGDEELPPYLTQIHSDTIDADLCDYLRRDAYHTGLALRYDDRALAWFRVDRESQRMFVDCEKGGMLREDITSELVRMLEIRFHFSERVYYHHAKIAAGAMIARMVEAALLDGRLTADDLRQATDESLLFHLESVRLSNGEDQARLRRLIERYRRRALLKRLAVLTAAENQEHQQALLDTFFDPNAATSRRVWEQRIEAEAQKVLGRPVDVLLYCPAREMQLKEARTQVRMPSREGAVFGTLEDFADRVPRLGDLARSYPRLWRLYVFSSETDRDARAQLQQVCLRELPDGCVNALRL